MKLWPWLRRRPAPVPDAMSHARRRVRLGQWVVPTEGPYRGQVGIVTEIRSDQPLVLDIMLTDEEGLNRLAIQVVGVESVRQARLAEVPEPRRLPDEAMHRLGYY